ncbi:MAG: (d)CMP kinase [Erysipelotrichaceae bacterium]|nr:(d)CMP kinase [Erysipelotrichaceae bacterium]MBQ1341910.1 (d)CMP kinase [Erysipelotrichaceae bacterium]MBQ2684930.1 (d)CMP kinase [Erysipelotrichaceae bacterium]MBR2599638.1 (d)CMP kinase [Erysipelotrichaceae bacterium]MBR3352653.1 (d)CMP kinase [Erysipelotrichaceae bacterium]
MDRKINIAIDGPSASGKSTIAKRLCRELGYKHLDTGAMYRCVALKVARTGINYKDKAAMKQLLDSINIDFTPRGKVLLDGEDVSSAIRTNEISMLASDVSTQLAVRQHLVKLQQEMSKNKGYVMDGRDIGTVVLPDAEVKIFMTASAETRAQRRYLENKERGIKSNLRALKQEIIERDYQDTHRTHSPLKKADDAIEIDTSDMTIVQVTDEILKIVESKL